MAASGARPMSAPMLIAANVFNSKSSQQFWLDAPRTCANPASPVHGVFCVGSTLGRAMGHFRSADVHSAVHKAGRRSNATSGAWCVNCTAPQRGQAAVGDLFGAKNDRRGAPAYGKPVGTMRNLIAAAIAALSVSGCVDTQEYPMAPNMVRLDISPPTAPFIGETTLRRAAEITLRNGYSAFRLEPIYVEFLRQFWRHRRHVSRQ